VIASADVTPSAKCHVGDTAATPGVLCAAHGVPPSHVCVRSTTTAAGAPPTRRVATTRVPWSPVTPSSRTVSRVRPGPAGITCSRTSGAAPAR